MAAPALLDRAVKSLAVSLIFDGLVIVNPQRRLTAIRFSIFRLCGRMRRSSPVPGGAPYQLWDS